MAHNGVINYTEFLAVVIDKQRILTIENLKLSFHHFQDSQGFITVKSLTECFRRQGTIIGEAEVKQIMSQVQHKDADKISFDEFCAAMTPLINSQYS